MRLPLIEGVLLLMSTPLPIHPSPNKQKQYREVKSMQIMRVEISRSIYANTYLVYHVLLLPHRVVGLLISTSVDSMLFRRWYIHLFVRTLVSVST